MLLPENTLCRGVYLADGAVGVVLQRLQTYRTAVARAVGQPAVVGEEVPLAAELHDRGVGGVAVARCICVPTELP